MDQDKEIGTGLPCGGPILYQTEFYYVKCLLTQVIRNSDAVWNYAVINSSTGIAEAYVSALPGAIIAATTLSDRTKELYSADQQTHSAH